MHIHPRHHTKFVLSFAPKIAFTGNALEQLRLSKTPKKLLDTYSKEKTEATFFNPATISDHIMH